MTDEIPSNVAEAVEWAKSRLDGHNGDLYRLYALAALSVHTYGSVLGLCEPYKGPAHFKAGLKLDAEVRSKVYSLIEDDLKALIDMLPPNL